jgi:hypothetical protein
MSKSRSVIQNYGSGSWCLLCTVICRGLRLRGHGVCDVLFIVREDDWVGLVSAMYCNMLVRMTGWAWCLLCTVYFSGG